jgi:fosfomycin resistance protein FosX
MQSRLNHIAIVAAEPERSARVFERILGATVTLPASGHRGPPEVSAHLPRVTLVFVPGTLAHTESPTAHVAFNVTSAELHASKRSLATLGLRFEEPRHGPKDRALYFVDYDNNLFELCATEIEHASEA